MSSAWRGAVARIAGRVGAQARRAVPGHKVHKRGYGKQWGRMGFQIGPDLIMSVQLRVTLPTYQALEAMSTNASRNAIQNMFRQIVYDPLIAEIEAFVGRIVPMDSGQLREAMMQRPRDSIVTLRQMGSTGFQMFLETVGVPYADVVNQMPSRKLKHHRSQRIRGRRSGQILHDPQAEGGWYLKTLKFAKRAARRHYKTFERRLAASLSPIIRAVTRFRPLTAVQLIFNTNIPTRP